MVNNQKFRDYVRNELTKEKTNNLKDVIVDTLAICIANNIDYEILDKNELTYYTFVFLVGDVFAEGPFIKGIKKLFRKEKHHEYTIYQFTGFLVEDAYNLLCDLFDKFIEYSKSWRNERR